MHVCVHTPMSTFYYNGRVYDDQHDKVGRERSGYVDAKTRREAICKIRKEVGGWWFDTIRAWNGESGRVLFDGLYLQPVQMLNGEPKWMGK